MLGLCGKEEPSFALIVMEKYRFLELCVCVASKSQRALLYLLWIKYVGSWVFCVAGKSRRALALFMGYGGVWVFLPSLCGC